GGFADEQRLCPALRLVREVLCGRERAAARQDEEMTGAVEFARLDHTEQQRLVLVVVAATILADVDDQRIDGVRVDESEEARGKSSDGFLVAVFALVVDGIDRFLVREIDEVERRFLAV